MLTASVEFLTARPQVRTQEDFQTSSGENTANPPEDSPQESGRADVASSTLRCG